MTEITNQKRIGAFFRKARENASMTLEEAAAKTGYDRSGISKIERGISFPRESTINTLLNTYNITPDDLASFISAPNYNELGRLVLSELTVDGLKKGHEVSLLKDIQFAISLLLEFDEEKSIILEIIDDHIKKVTSIQTSSLNEMEHIKNKEDKITHADNQLMLMMLNSVIASRSSIDNYKRVRWIFKSMNEENTERLMARVVSVLLNE